MIPEYCEHLRPADTCTPCSVAELVGYLDQLHSAVHGARKSSVRGQAVAGGQPSWEPIDIRPLSLLQDIARDGRSLERQLRTLLHDPRVDPAIDAAEVLWRLPNLLDRTAPAEAVAGQVRGRIFSWRNRARVILDKKIPPYPLVMETVVETPTVEGERVRQAVGIKVKCPVIDQRGVCGGQLLVHRNSNDLSQHYGDVERVTCSRHDSHSWNDKREWLRLRVLIGDVLKTAS